MKNSDLHDEDYEELNLKGIIPEKLLCKAKVIKIKAGEIIISQGGKPLGIYLLLKGKVQIESLVEDGKDVTFCIEGPISLIGALEIYQVPPSNMNLSTVSAINDASLLFIKLDYVKRIGSCEPLFLKFICNQLASKLLISSSMKVNIAMNAKKRVCNYLLEEFYKYGDIIKLERREIISSMLSISVRHLNRILAELHKENIIKLSNKDVTIKRINSLKDN